MKFSQFFDEAVRVQDVPKTKDTEEKRKIRAPGDVGPVDRLTQIDKDKARTVTQRNVGGRMAQAFDRIQGDRLNEPDEGETKEVARDYSKRGQYTKRAQQYQDPVDKLLSTQGDEEPDMDPRFDPDSPQYQKKSRGGKEIQKGMTQGYQPGMDAVSSADRTMRDTVRDAESGAIRDPLNIRGLQQPIKDTAYLKHGYQSSGVGLNKKLGQDDLDYIFSAIDDPEPVGKKKDKAGVIDSKGIEDTKRRRPSGRDIEALDPKAEKAAADKKAYLTPEVMAQQKALRDATDKQDAKGVQRVAFQHKVTPEMVDKFIDMYGLNQQKNSNLLTRVKGFGATAPASARYGGDLGPEGKKYQNEDGTYNYSKMPKSLRNKAEMNRARAMIEVYLKQGGRDAYSPHEGIRSIADMDLEHIRSLKSTRDPGKDDPSNWVFAGSELNRLRGERDLTGPGSAVEKQAQGERRLADDAFETMGKTFDEFTGGDTELETALKDTFGGDPRERGAKAGIFAKGKYKSMPEEERERLRDLAREEGFNDAQVMKLFPSEEPQAGEVVTASEFGTRGLPYMDDPEQYDDDTTLDARDAVLKRKVIAQISKKYPGIGKEERDQTPEYQDFLAKINMSKQKGAQQAEPLFDDEGME